MYTIIGSDQKEYGPASAEDLRQWLADGRINAQTRARQEGGDWKPLAGFSEIFQAGGMTAEGAPPVAGVDDVKNLAAGILARERRLEVVACVRRSWDLVRENFWISVGATFLVMLISSVISMVPFLGGIAGLILNGVFSGGLYWFFLKLIRKEAAGVGDAFAGFQRDFIQLMLTGLVISLLTLLATFVILVPFGIAALVMVMTRTMSAHGLVLIVIPAGVLVFPVLVFLSVIWVFAIPMVVDRKVGFWDAMELSRKVVLKQWWRVFGLLFLCGLVAILGMLALIVGVFVAMPVAVGAVAYAYEDLFGPNPAPTA